jgi:hypothetical protein
VRDKRIDKAVSTRSRSKIFLQLRLDDPNQPEMVQQIEFYAHAIPADSRPGKQCIGQKTIA